MLWPTAKPVNTTAPAATVVAGLVVGISGAVADLIKREILHLVVTIDDCGSGYRLIKMRTLQSYAYLFNDFDLILVIAFPILYLWCRHARLFCVTRQPVLYRKATRMDKPGFCVHRKPEWVVHELIRFKALMPDAGCRQIAHTFNRCFAQPRNMPISKYYVSTVLRQQALAVLRLRTEIRNRIEPVCVWYNTVRPHQHLSGLTPLEVWERRNPYQNRPQRIEYFSAWDGLLTGFYIRC